MASTRVQSLLLDSAVLSDKEKKFVTDYQEVRSLNLFSDNDFSYIQDMDANNFHTWCIEVLAAHFWISLSIERMKMLNMKYVYSNITFAKLLLNF